MTPEQEKLAAELFKLDFDFPESLGACIDLLYKMRENRHQLQRKLEDLKKDEGHLRDHIFQHFDQQEIAGARGQRASANIVRNIVAQVTNFERAVAWIARRKAYDLLYRRIADSAYRDRLEEGIEIPGVLPFEDVKLSLTKIGAKK